MNAFSCVAPLWGRRVFFFFKFVKKKLFPNGSYHTRTEPRYITIQKSRPTMEPTSPEWGWHWGLTVYEVEIIELV